MSKTAPEQNPIRGLVAANLKRLRRAAGYSQEGLAVAAGFHRTYVSQIERERINVTVDGIWRLAVLLGVDVMEFFSPLED
ncbi:helix-turn-helix transcriptional regulator [Paraburkholderia sp. A3BS-1L]|uniref:helix-turn-helix domain-containing protein n=1 Tax=Paraburkholderia sp. A3BS-1L TaxID=3028375 RepID=UPI003DA8DB0E